MAAVAAFLSCSCGKGTEQSPASVNKPVASTKLPGKPAEPKPNNPALATADFNFQRPALVKGIYLTAWSAASPKKLAKMIDMIHSTELNSVVIDVRDSGDMYFPTHIALSDEVQGKKNLAVVNPKKLMTRLADAHVWPIARIACFRDNYVPLKHPERAVQFADGKPWHDRSKHYWLDPYDKRNWMYVAETVDYAMSIGFPEIQLDYVRFPSEGKSSSQVFPNEKKYSDKPTPHEDVIKAFTEYIHDRVKKHHCYLSVDIFGIISESKSDQGIGQELEKVSSNFDTLSPMIYPSHFAKGEYGIKDPNQSPYEIIMKSLHDYHRRLPKAEVRPWLQDFTLGHVHYGVKEVRAQLKALNDSGYKEFLLWNAGNNYTPGGARTKQEAEKDESKMKPLSPDTAQASAPPAVSPPATTKPAK